MEVGWELAAVMTMTATMVGHQKRNNQPLKLVVASILRRCSRKGDTTTMITMTNNDNGQRLRTIMMDER